MRNLAAPICAAAAVAAASAATSGCSPEAVPLPETLSRELAVESYRRYASYDEAHMDPDEYLESFPFSGYRLRDLPGYAKFYLDDLDDVIKNYLRRGEEWEPDIGAFIKQYVREGTNVVDVAATTEETNASTASMCSSSTGRTGVVSLAGVRPRRSPPTACNWVKAVAGSNSFSVAHRNIRLIRETFWLIVRRACPMRTNSSRQALSASGPNSSA